MCCIIVCDQVRVDRDSLRSTAQANRDGLGIAWISRKGRVVWRKGLPLSEVWDLASKVPMPYVIHARLATVGDACDQLTHPFPIEDSPRLLKAGIADAVLFHNGHEMEWRAFLAAAGKSLPPKAKGWSDSRAIAHVVHRAGPEFLHELSSKFTILSTAGVKTFGYFQEVDGVKFSSPPLSVGGFYRYMGSQYKSPKSSSAGHSGSKKTGKVIKSGENGSVIVSYKDNDKGKDTESLALVVRSDPMPEPAPTGYHGPNKQTADPDWLSEIPADEREAYREHLAAWDAYLAEEDARD